MEGLGVIAVVSRGLILWGRKAQVKPLAQLCADSVNHALAKRGANQGAKLFTPNLPVVCQQTEPTGVASGAMLRYSRVLLLKR